MFEKVNPSHPDKVADRIAGACVDLAYKNQKDPKVAVEVLIGHGVCHIIAETSYVFDEEEVASIVERIDGKNDVLDLRQVPQDYELAENQSKEIRCGDNGIFKGTPTTSEERDLTNLAKRIYSANPYDGKYFVDKDQLTICQSHCNSNKLLILYPEANKMTIKINPLGDWTGGTNVDTGATNRKIGSDMGGAATGGGLHGKDLSKADVSVNIYAHLMAEKEGHNIELSCSIGDDTVYGKKYSEIVEIARQYIKSLGGFEKFAEWGLIR